MKKLVLAIVALGVSAGAFAQGQPMGFGIKAGVNFPKYNFSGDNAAYQTNSSTNFHVTAFLDAPILTDYLYIQPGVSLQGKGAKFAEGSFLGNDYELTQNTMWLEVPVNLVAKLPTGYTGNFFIGAGPYLGFGLSGKYKASGDDGSIESDFKFGNDEDMKGVDFGLNFIAGYQLNNGLMIHGGYGLGLTDLTPDGGGDAKQTNRVWTVGLGFAL